MLAQMIQRFKKIWRRQGSASMFLAGSGVRREQNLADWNTRKMWEITFGKPQERKETDGGEGAVSENPPASKENES